MNLARLFFFSIFTVFFFDCMVQQKVIAQEDNLKIFEEQHKSEKSNQINYWTNYFFQLLRPEVSSQTMMITEKLYRRERAEIRKVINKVIFESCQIPDINHYYLIAKIKGDRLSNWQRNNYHQTEFLWDEQLWHEGYYWQQTKNYFFSGFYADLTDAVFYARHPELSRKIAPGDDLNWSAEWSFIRQHFIDFEQEKLLKQYLIPICDREQD